MSAYNFLPYYKSSFRNWVLGLHIYIYIYYPKQLSMVINFSVLDKYESNHTGDGETDRRTRMEVRTGKIYKFIGSIVVTCGVTECWALITGVIVDMF